MQSLETINRSPRGAVIVRITKMNDIDVVIDPEYRRGLDETKMAEEIEAAVVKAWLDHKDQIQEIVAAQGVPKSSPENRPVWAGEFEQEAASIEAHGDSCNGHVSAYWGGNGRELFVELKNNVVRRTDINISLLNSEITEAIMNARRAFVSEYGRVLRRFQSIGKKAQQRLS